MTATMASLVILLSGWMAMEHATTDQAIYILGTSQHIDGRKAGLSSLTLR